MIEPHQKYQPSDWQMKMYAISGGFFFAYYFVMVIWGNLLSDYVDLATRKTTGEYMTILFMVFAVWNIRESIPLVVLFFKNMHYEIYIEPREHEAEMQRIRDEWLHASPTPPKPRRQPKMKPVGEPVNLRQWVGQRSYHDGGYIYVLKDIEISGYYKIGKTRQPYDRMKAFGVRLPFETDLIHVIECWNADRVEAQLHNKFADKRKQGEWFALTDEDIKWLKLHNRIEAA